MSVSADIHTYSASPNPITIIKADISTLDVDAIVNATNEALFPVTGSVVPFMLRQDQNWHAPTNL